MKEKNFWNRLLILTFGLADIITTWLGQTVGLKELNPLINYLLTLEYGWLYFLILKIFYLIIFIKLDNTKLTGLIIIISIFISFNNLLGWFLQW